MNATRIRVLIIDDSAFARKVVREVLERDSEFDVVGFARDGLDALEKVAELKPDVITLDLVMPSLDGIGFLKALPKENAPRVVVVSASAADSEQVFEALQLGAVDIITKPNTLPTDKLYDLSAELIRKVKAAYLAQPRVPTGLDLGELAVLDIGNAPYRGSTRLVVLGTSTGGPQAISEIFSKLPANFPVPLVIALHIPPGYTEPLAERVSRNSQLSLVEAYDGMELVAGKAVIAPGGMHLFIKERHGKIYASVSLEPLTSAYHPSVDLLFESATEALGSKVMGVVLTGMGSDGTIGAQAIRKAGGHILAESKSTCVVYGMPRSVIEAGAANAEAPLEEMTALLLKSLFDVQ